MALAATSISHSAVSAASWQAMQQRTVGRFTIEAEPQDQGLAESLLRSATANDTFPGLPRPVEPVRIIIAPNRDAFRRLVGPGAPEYGSAIAVPGERRIVVQGSRAGSDAGYPPEVLRHELAHLALHERMDDVPPRWFDEGYAAFAAGEWGRDEVIATNVVLALRGMPSFEALDAQFAGGAQQATAAYALAYRAVAELAELDPERGLSLFLQHWRATGDLDLAIRQSYGLTESEFIKRWRDSTRRRYGALALFADITVAATIVLLVVVPLYLVRRRRDRERLAGMVRTEREAERREREAAIDELLRSVAPPPPDEPHDAAGS